MVLSKNRLRLLLYCVRLFKHILKRQLPKLAHLFMQVIILL